jgi:hypothetical protein
MWEAIVEGYRLVDHPQYELHVSDVGGPTGMICKLLHTASGTVRPINGSHGIYYALDVAQDFIEETAR